MEKNRVLPDAEIGREISSHTPNEAEPESRGSTGTFALWQTALRAAIKEQWGDPWGYLFILPAVSVFLVFNAWPVARGIAIAFQDYRFLHEGPYPFNGVDNFVEIIEDKLFWESLGRSFKYVLLYVPANILLSLLIATLIASVWNPILVGTYRTISYLPVILPVSVAMLLWKHLFNGQYGYLNYAIDSLLGSGLAPNWISDPNWVMPSMAISAIWKNCGYNILLFLIGLYSIHSGVYEAANIDGANAWQRFLYISLPLLRPIFVIILVLSAATISVTQEPLIWFPTTSGPAGPQNSALTAGYYAYKIAFLYGDWRWGYAAAINLVLGLLAMFWALIVFRLLRYERLM